MSEDPDRAEGRETRTDDRMQRVRVGLTGLAVVLLIAALVTAVLRRVDEQVAPPGANNAAAADPSPSEDEPLAALGVAPGAANADDNAVSPKQ